MCRKIIVYVTAALLTLGWLSSNAAALNSSYALTDVQQAVNVNKLGISGDGKSDVTTKVQQALAKYKSLYFPKGTYLFSRSVELTSGNIITGITGTTFTNRAGFIGEGFFVANAKTNIAISTITFANKVLGKPVYALLLNDACRQVSVSRITASQCGILHSVVSNASYRQIADGQRSGSSSITVNNCTGTGTAVVMGIYLEYANSWKVLNSTFTGYHHGVEWWGGDSNPQKDGALSNPRLSKTGQVTNVTVSSVTEGGIWGSMGDGITVSRCRVSNCGDVGIDFEGCFNSQANNNTVSNCRNGALATFHFNKNVVFNGNKVSQTNATYPLARINNSAQTPDNRTITFTNNTFTAVKGVGAIDQHGPAQSIRFSHNKLSNVVLDLAFNNNQLVQIDHNTFTITRPAPSRSFIIKAGDTNSNGRVVIENNTLSQPATLNAQMTGIYVTQFDYNSTPVNVISNNILTGLKKPYKIEWNGQNGGVTNKTYITTQQKLSPAAIEKGGQAKNAPEIYINGIKQ
ncbi:right-handed parallel beta-helix repeat-containing protein [Mucilaginibacter lacusdianchii]|uniref:right-handed parallel beta-helix repeat-containing protein n=1 Tax=Mucilaginibacter lacusdianchii TaxID=2684211 RepID=UPI00131E3654|nr:right-handed parallel beta-helix repeat-containing protein [Mucilaginibacter sp. JXJ CY 39]